MLDHIQCSNWLFSTSTLPEIFTFGKLKLAEGDAVYQEWYATHEKECDINHEGSAGLMEVDAARVMWGRSHKKRLRYTSIS